jgi:hypothetical protein
MTARLTKKQEDFCYAFTHITNFDADNAFDIAKYEASTKEMRNDMIRDLMREPKIKARIAELIEEKDAQIVIDRTYVREKLKQVVEETGKGQHYNAHLKALELLGKDLGLFSGDKEDALNSKDSGEVANEIFTRRKARILETRKKEGDKDVANENQAIEASN